MAANRINYDEDVEGTGQVLPLPYQTARNHNVELFNETLIQTTASDGLIDIDQALFRWYWWESLMIRFQFVLSPMTMIYEN